jgi:hypothetical protein
VHPGLPAMNRPSGQVCHDVSATHHIVTFATTKSIFLFDLSENLAMLRVQLDQVDRNARGQPPRVEFLRSVACNVTIACAVTTQPASDEEIFPQASERALLGSGAYPPYKFRRVWGRGTDSVGLGRGEA